MDCQWVWWEIKAFTVSGLILSSTVTYHACCKLLLGALEPTVNIPWARGVVKIEQTKRSCVGCTTMFSWNSSDSPQNITWLPQTAHCLSIWFKFDGFTESCTTNFLLGHLTTKLPQSFWLNSVDRPNHSNTSHQCCFVVVIYKKFINIVQT